MGEQNFKNHSRYIPLFHYVTGGAIIVTFIMSIINLIHSGKEDLHASLLFILVSLILASLFWFAREFAVKVQDRAIRAEENFRHFILTGKPLDSRLRMGQIIALRFASDGEMPALAKRAVEENLSQKQIKEAIQNWRPDHHRA